MLREVRESGVVVQDYYELMSDLFCTRSEIEEMAQRLQHHVCA